MELKPQLQYLRFQSEDVLIVPYGIETSVDM